MKKTTTCKISRIEDNKRINGVDDIIVIEYPLSIFLNGKKLATLLCSPENIKALVIGFLRTEEIINRLEDILSFNLDKVKGTAGVQIMDKTLGRESFSKKINLENIKAEDKKEMDNFLESLNCEAVSEESNITITVQKIFEFMKKNLDYSEIFKNTGGVHCVSLADGEKVLEAAEDVARHNALDKVIGEAFMKNIFLKDKVLILSGRVSLEMILKAAKLGIPIIISKSAPTSLSVSLAKRLNMTLVGFVRKNKMNIYTGGHRIKDN